MAKQGEFIAQVRGARKFDQKRPEKFSWSETLATPPKEKRPRGRLDGKPIEQAAAPLGKDLPVDTNGAIDIAQVRKSVSDQLKAQRKKRGF